MAKTLKDLRGEARAQTEAARREGAAGRADNGLIEIVSLLNAEGLRRIITNLVRNFVEFAPLGTVLVAMLGVGVAEQQIRPADIPHEEGVAGEHEPRLVRARVIGDHVRHVLGRVPGREEHVDPHHLPEDIPDEEKYRDRENPDKSDQD